MTGRTQVAILGAGFSGLAAAVKLQQSNIDFVVLEARARVGGRTWTRYLDDGLQIDLGGQWIGPTQTRMYELAAEYGSEIFPLQEVGETFALIGGKRESGMVESVQQALAALDELAATVNLQEPEATPHAAELDDQTLQSWLLANVEEEAVALVGRVLAGGLLGKSAGEVSMLQILFYIKSGSGVDLLLGTCGGAQQDRLIGGPFGLAQRLASVVADRLELGFSVAQVNRVEESWEIVSSDGRTIVADRVISTIPPAVLGRVSFSPPLPSGQRRALRSLLPGNALKFHAIYPSPIWHDVGLSGVFNADTGLITEAVDNSVPGNGRGVMTFFVYGDDSAALTELPETERQQVLLDELAAIFDDDRYRHPEEFVAFSWEDEPYTGGCFSSSFAVGALHKYGHILREPFDGLHFAGTETAEIWNGYFEGAVRSGEREAARVIASLPA